MIVKVLKTTDRRHEGAVFEVPVINYEVCKSFGMIADRIAWFDDICILQNVNYTIKLKKIGD